MQRHTVQKTIVLNAIKKLANHPTADAVYDCVHQEYPNISRATVFRVLNQLAEDGTLLRIDFPGGARHFDHNNQDHLHIICQECGKIIDGWDEEIPQVRETLNKVKTINEASITNYTLVFKGICKECQEKGSL